MMYCQLLEIVLKLKKHSPKAEWYELYLVAIEIRDHKCRGNIINYLEPSRAFYYSNVLDIMERQKSRQKSRKRLKWIEKHPKPYGQRNKYNK